MFGTPGLQHAIETTPGFIKKLGAQLMAGKLMRFFPLTNKKRLYSFDNWQFKSCIDLSKMADISARDLQSETNKKFSSLTQERKWNFECINTSDKDGPTNSVKCTRKVANGKYDNCNNDDDNIGSRGSLLVHVGGGGGSDLKKNESTRLNSNHSSNTNSAASKAVREKTEEWIDKLLSETIDRFDKLSKENNEIHINIDSGETNESLHSILK